MKNLIFTSLLLFFATNIVAQQTYKPKKRKKDFFGKENLHNRPVGNFGMHIGIGPSFVKAGDNSLQAENMIYYDPTGTPYNYEISQKGKIGANVSAGFNLFSKKAGWFSFGRLIDYYELGAGFNYYRGTENTSLSDAANRNNPDLFGEGKFTAGLLSGRFSIHKILTIPKSNFFLDNGLAFHGEYNLMKANTNYQNFIPIFAKYSPDFTMQLNYSLGIGFSIGKGSYLVPMAFLPVFSIQEMGKQAVHWFDSKYYPINLQIKWIYRFNKSKSSTSCTTPDKGPMPPPPAEGQ